MRPRVAQKTSGLPPNVGRLGVECWSMMTTDPDNLPRYSDYQLPGYAHLGEERVFVSVELPESLLRRVNGAVRYASDTGKIDGIQSRTDLLRVALHCYLIDLEAAHNAGLPFPPPATTGRGRGADRAEPWPKVGSKLPKSLWDRAQGAAAYAQATGAIDGVTRVNQLTAAACAEFLDAIEQKHHRGKPFQDPRTRR